MGWANCGTDSNGRRIGYGFVAKCDFPGCRHKIDRGLSYACGDMHGEDNCSCEKYFCSHHRRTVVVLGHDTSARYGSDICSVSLCLPCADAYEASEAGRKAALLDDPAIGEVE